MYRHGFRGRGAAISANAVVGGTAVTDYTLTVNPGGATFTASSSPITATALTNDAAGTGASSAASNVVTPVAAQIITFTNPGSQTVGIVSTLTATTSSGLLYGDQRDRHLDTSDGEYHRRGIEARFLASGRRPA